MKSRRQVALSRREAQLMQILWEREGATAPEVREQLGDGSAESTIRTHLTTLVRKGFARRSGQAHSYRYVPKVPREKLARPALDQLLDRFFSGSGRALVLQMLDSGALCPEELEELARRFRRR